MQATIVFEKAPYGRYTCYMQESIPNIALFGYGSYSMMIGVLRSCNA